MLYVASVHPGSVTAGLSPNKDKRTEVFLAGCRMAREGHPCPGCFNTDLWDDTYFPRVTSEELIREIEAIGNPYITIVGGEPLDQYAELIGFLQLLKRNKGVYHVVLITHFTMDVIERQYPAVLEYVNVIIDGVYIAQKRIFDEELRPGVHHVIGSSNQQFWHKSEDNWKNIDIYNGNLREAYCA